MQNNSIYIYFFIGVISLIPILMSGAVANKAGFSRWWGILIIIPFLNLIAIWVLAYVKWPSK